MLPWWLTSTICTPIAITNNIVVSHTVGISVTQGGTATVSYTLWHANGADIAGAGVVTQTHPVMGDPAFADPAADDYHLPIAWRRGMPATRPACPPRRSMTLTTCLGPRARVGHRCVRVERALAASADGIEINHPAWAGLSVRMTPARAAIAHTTDGGLTWQAQGDLSAWTGVEGTDINAVDDQTAWAALGSGGSGATLGAILHTTDGGVTGGHAGHPARPHRRDQERKGPQPQRSLGRLVDGRDPAHHRRRRHLEDHPPSFGPHHSGQPHGCDRRTRLGRRCGRWAVVHSPDGGSTWQAIPLPDDSPLTVHAFTPQAIWASGSDIDVNPSFYRTLDGGEEWIPVDHLGALIIWTMCAPPAPMTPGACRMAMASAATSGGGHVAEDGTPEATKVSPPELGGYTPGGVTCLDANVAWVVARKGVVPAPGKPLGLTLFTVDGGEHWVVGTGPTNIRYWKVSFAGARR